MSTEFRLPAQTVPSVNQSGTARGRGVTVDTLVSHVGHRVFSRTLDVNTDDCDERQLDHFSVAFQRIDQWF